MIKQTILWLWAVMALMPCLLYAQNKGKDKNAKNEKWDVSKHQRSYKTVSIDTDEGTWMNVDISPDGKQIVFDMLGDIFIMSSEGGKAKLLRGGLPFEVQPRFSPDGKRIAFTSDAGGGDNIWVMNIDGSNAKQVTKEKFRLLNAPAWTPDSQYIIARKHFTSGRSLGAGAMWMYHISGGMGTELVAKKNDQQDINEPCVSPDGRYLYFAEDSYPGGYFQYNKDPNSQIYVIKRYDRQTGETVRLIGGSGGAHTPQASRDGKKLAFIKRVRTQSVLYVHDLLTGEQKPIMGELSKDQQEAWAIFGVYTKYNWTPDDKHIVIWNKGKICKVNVETLEVTHIPFEVSVEHQIADALRYKQEIAPDKFDVKVIRHSVTSPDQKVMYFNALGYLWEKELPKGKPVRITAQSGNFEYEPALSADGSKMVYVTWNDQDKGALWMLDLNIEGAQPEKISEQKGIYRMPTFSPDGKSVAYVKEYGNDQQGYAFTVLPGIYTMNLESKEVKHLTDSGEYPQYSVDGKRIYYQTGGFLFGSLKKAFRSVNLDGEDKKTHFTSKYSNQFVLSPDNNWVAFTELFKVYVAPMPKVGKPIELSANTKVVPVAQLAKDAGLSLHWSADNRRVFWTLGQEYFSTDLKEHFAFLEGAPEKLAEPKSKGLPIGLEVQSDKPEGTIALKGAKIITVDAHNNVIENGVVLVKDNRIVQIGEVGKVKIPKDAYVMDVSGKTIMPGIVDVHAHLGAFRLGLSTQQNWNYYANLAYGVTTTHDPSANSEMVFAQSEMVKAGKMVGPRIFSTGIILYGADGDFKAVINTLDDARSAIRRTKAYGAFSVKSYNQPRREQRQQVIKAAEEESIMVVPEGGSFFYHNMSMILDGHTGLEHNIPVYPAYKDVLDLWSASKTGYTPTLIVNYGSISGEYYWYQKTNVWEKERLLKYTPRTLIDSRSRHRIMIPDEEYEIGHIASSKLCKALTDRGVKVNLGAHGQLQGLGAHWELWMLHQGGMTNMEAIRAATMNGAHYIGMDHDIGSLEKGKLADLIILDKDPLKDIYNTEYISHTMINGRLYEAETMNEVGLKNKPREKFYWEQTNYSENFNWHEGTNSFSTPKCGCGVH